MTSGVVVVSPSGAPDATSQIRVRGIGSTNGSDPLYIIDGFAVSGGLDYLNPNDIERKSSRMPLQVLSTVHVQPTVSSS